MQTLPGAIGEFSALLGIQFLPLSPDKLWQENYQKNIQKAFYSLNDRGEVNGLLLHNFSRAQSQFNHELGRLIWFPELETLDLQEVLLDPFEIEALVHCPKLRLLCLDNNGLETIGPIDSCPELVELSLYNNRIGSIEPLLNLVHLEALWLAHNQIQDLRPLASLTALKKLWTQSNQISDVSSLSGLTGLIQLSLSDNQIVDVSPLASLTKLKSLWLHRNKIKEVSSLAQLNNLMELGLKHNLIEDLAPIAHLRSQLNAFEIDGNPLLENPRHDSGDEEPANGPEPAEPPTSAEPLPDLEEPDRGPGVAKVANDGIEGGDLLGVKEELKVIAQALAMVSVRPPLVVGLLGGWGSGKSFAMHLIREELAEIRAMRAELLPAGQGPEGQGEFVAYVGHLYTIDFNAWTYAKSNLWASLMQEIFTQLDAQVSLEQLLAQDLAAKTKILNPTKELTIAEVLAEGGTVWKALLQPERERMNALMKEMGPEHRKELNKDGALWDQLAALQEKQREKYKNKLIELKAADAQKSAADRALKTAETDFETRKKAALDELEWTLMAKNLGASLGENVAKELGFPGVEVKEFAEKWREEIAQTLGIPKKELGGIGQTLEALAKHAKSFSWPKLSRLPMWLVFLLVAVNCLLPFADEAFSWFNHKLEVLWVEALSAGAWIYYQWQQHKHQLTKWIEKAKQFLPTKETLDQERAKVQEAFNEESSNAKPLEQARKDANAAEDQLTKVQAEVTEARKRAGFIACHQSLNDFLQARLDEGGYREKLGLMHQVQQDLAELSAMLMGQQLEQKLFPRGKPRVVLFVDDLDRCPPEMVVQVLEATQLLCKTDLFVVVLAVDMRFVTRALEKTYAGILNKRQPPTGLDYVEKIIQIPYQMHIHAAESLAQLFGPTSGSEQQGTKRGISMAEEAEAHEEEPAAETEVQVGDQPQKPAESATAVRLGPAAEVEKNQPQVSRSRGLGFKMGPSEANPPEAATSTDSSETSKATPAVDLSIKPGSYALSVEEEVNLQEVEQPPSTQPATDPAHLESRAPEVRAKGHQVYLSEEEGRQLAEACEAVRLTPRSCKRVGNNYCLIKAVLLNKLRDSMESAGKSTSGTIAIAGETRTQLCIMLVLVEAWPERMGRFFHGFREADPTTTLSTLFKAAGIQSKPWLDPIAKYKKAETDPKIIRLIRAFSFVTDTADMP